MPNEALYGVLRISRLITWTYLRWNFSEKQGAKLRTPTKIFYFSTVATICFSPKPRHRKDRVKFIFSPRSRRRRVCVYWETHRRTVIWNFNWSIKLCGIWFILRLTPLDTLHRFREVPHASLFISKNLGWFACFRIKFLPDHKMIHSCLV